MNTTELKKLAEAAPKGRWMTGSYVIWKGNDKWHPVHVQKRGLMAESKTAAMSDYIAAANPGAILELLALNAELVEALKAMEEIGALADGELGYHGGIPEAQAKARAALAKAEGGDL